MAYPKVSFIQRFYMYTELASSPGLPLARGIKNLRQRRGTRLTQLRKIGKPQID